MKQRLLKFILFSLSLLSPFILMQASSAGQTATSSVRGTVVDQQGKVIPGAVVTLKHSATNFARAKSTDGRGEYIFTLIPPGTYVLEVEASGFKKFVVSDIKALIDTPLNVNVALEVGTVAETVAVVNSTDTRLNTTDATLGTAFEARRISELPLNARSVVQLLSLEPGVTRMGEVNGGRRDQANVVLDGIDINEQQTGLDVVSGDAFGSVLRVTPDSVQEFRVTTSVPNAEQGRSGGAQVSLITKSGTNQFHGSAYEYHRNTVTTANDYFNNAAGRYTTDDPQVLAGIAQAGDQRVPRPKLLRHIFGGSIGGPIVKDRFYFFYTYEGRRDAEEQSVLQTVPTTSLRQGIVRYVNMSGGITTLTPADVAALYPATGGVNPAGLTLLGTAPLPNDFSIGDGLNIAGFRFNAPISSNLNVHIARLDYIINSKQSFYLRATYQDDLYGQAPAFPTTPAPKLWIHPQGYMLGHNWNISNTLVNNFRVGLTRQSFTQTGDSDKTLVNFRFVYQPRLYRREMSRTTPVLNFTDDISWIKNAHTIQFGFNLHFIRNNRTSYAKSFDGAVVNPAFYALNGTSLSDPLTDISDEAVFNTRAAIAAVLGRFSQYSYNVVYDREGNTLPAGAPSQRTFATQEYEFYAQDSWRLRSNLTLSYGLRWGVNTPVTETHGFEVAPTVSLGDFFGRRMQSAFEGRPFNELITFDLAGKANGSHGLYGMDWNNFAPSISAAWSPDFGDNLFGRAFGRQGQSVLRGGFRIIYDRMGSALAVNFDLNNALGFSSSNTIAPNVINTTTQLGPLYTGLGQNIRNFPFLTVPGPIRFPLAQPADNSQRIEQAIDDTLKTPVQYTWNLTYGRELPKGFSFEASYIGRRGRHLLVERDIMQFNNLRDPDSGQTWYDAAGVLADWRFRDLPFSAITPIPYFENLFLGLGDYLFGEPTLTPTQAMYRLVASPAQGGANNPDWTSIQTLLNNASPRVGPNAFFHPQYGTLSVLSSVGSSNYHGLTLSLRQRFKSHILLDVNYTFSKSLDDGSPLESDVQMGNNLTRNSFDLSASRSVSDFDVRHNLNANWLVVLPFGRGEKFWSGMSPVANALLGGWQLAGIFRWHSGLPAGAPFDLGFWSTNWQITSNGVRLHPVSTCNCIVGGAPNIFSDPIAAYQAFRNARAGEVGERNTFRFPSYIVLDAGVSKSFKMWYAEKQSLQFRWEIFNVTNTQRFGVISDFSLNQNPYSGAPNPDFGRYVGSQTPVGESRPGRTMQFALRYTF